MNSRLLILAIGTFAIGTDGFVIAGILQNIANDVHVSIGEAGLLVTGFALMYAISAPIAGAVVSKYPRRVVLIGSMFLFAVANFLAATATSFVALMAWRALAAVSAAMYSPAAVGIAVQMSPPEKRGSAASVVFAGMTLSLVTGVPLGTFLAGLGSWRTTFVFVGVVAALACVLLWLLMPAMPGSAGSTLAARLRPLGRPVVVANLASGFLWMTGGMAIYTYVVPLLQQATGWPEAAIAPVLLVYGFAAILGNILGGKLSDRFGPKRALVGLLTLHATSMVLLASAASLGPTAGIALLAIGLPLFACSGWATTPPQTSRLTGAAPESTVEVMSLSTSATYFGISAGAALGGWVIGISNIQTVCWVGLVFQFLALGVILFFGRVSRNESGAPSAKTA